jgi:hypothetical protein
MVAWLSRAVLFVTHITGICTALESLPLGADRPAIKVLC